MLIGMITKQRYVQYLICTPINYTCFNLPEHLAPVSHDGVSNFLKQRRITARHVWELVKGLINNTENAFLIIDDSVPDKRYSKSVEVGQETVQRCGGRPGQSRYLPFDP